MSAGEQSSQTGHRPGAPAAIIDIRSTVDELNLKDDLTAMMNPREGPKKLPTLLLYDERGLQLFEQITYLDEYYLTNKEIQVLQKHAKDMAAAIPQGTMLVELGSGNLRKVNLILQAFEDARKPIDYYALDVSHDELERTLAQVPDYEHVSCHGLWGTYDDGRDWLERKGNAERPKCVLHLGSSIGNFHRHEAVDFLSGFSRMLGPEDSMVVAVDTCQDPDRVFHAYNDVHGVTHQFILNGLVHANTIQGEDIFHLPDWQVSAEYVYDDQGGRHQAFVMPSRDVHVLGTLVKAGERVQIEQSLKYSKASARRLFRLAGLVETERWADESGDYGVHLLRKPEMAMPLQPEQYASSPIPTLDDWASLWATWDTVTRSMLPPQDLQEKPIKLRNACIFYLGHIPTFLDIQLSKTLPTSHSTPTHPQDYWRIFERGVDPDVDNPEKCHDHSEIPDEWPCVEDILAYQGRVRARLLSLYDESGEKLRTLPGGPKTRDVGRAVWCGFEHEAMHLETLLYMMLQSDKTRPPPHVARPDFAALAEEARASRVEDEWFHVPTQTITVGTDDREDGTDTSVFFAWDNEKPKRTVEVPAFHARGRPITNEEYARYVASQGITRLPASWTSTATTDGRSEKDDVTLLITETSVRTVFGLVPLRHALDWPVSASYDELAGCAAWMGGRIPTADETRSLYEHAEAQSPAEASSKLTRKVPAVNAHLVNNGVEETPPSPPSSTLGSGSSELFADLATSTTGFRSWHPTPVTSSTALLGRGSIGGVWEWTSSTLARHGGFEPMTLYPNYTADFFDGKHNVVLGGSWATHPRIAGRKSFVNFYQRGYLYAWAGARVVRDA